MAKKPKRELTADELAAQQKYLSNYTLPTLNAGEVSSLLDRASKKSFGRGQKYGDGNSLFLPASQKFGDDFGGNLGANSVKGLNIKSVASNITTGAALFGIYKDLKHKGNPFSTAGEKAASQADFDKAAKAAGVNIAGMNTQQAYDAINAKGQGIYAVSSRATGKDNPIDPTTGKVADHFFALYKKDGNNLVPVTNPQTGMPVVKTFNSGWHQEFNDFSTFIRDATPGLIMGASFLLPGIGAGLTSGIANTSLGATLGTIGTSALSSSLMSIGMAALTGGDIGKAALTGAIGGGLSVGAVDITKGLLGADKIAELSQITGIKPDNLTKMIAGGLSTGIVSAVTDPNHIGQNVIASIASNFASEKAKTFIKDNINVSNVDVLAKAVGSTVQVATDALAKGQDIGDAISNSAGKIALSAGKTLTTPIEDRSTNPDGTKVATDDTQDSALDYLNNSTAGLNNGTMTDVGAGTRPDQASGLQAREGETAGAITTETLPDGSEAYSRTITGKTADGKDYSYIATWDPSNTEHPYYYQTFSSVDPNNITQGGEVVAGYQRPTFDSSSTNNGGLDTLTGGDKTKGGLDTDVSGDNTDEIEIFTTSPINVLDSSDIKALTSSDLDTLTTSALDTISTSDLETFTTSDLSNFTTSALDTISTSNLDSFTTSDLVTLSTNDLDTISTSDLDSLTTSDLDTISTSALDTLGTSDLDSLTTSDLDSLTTSDLDLLTTSDLEVLGTSDLDVLSTNDLENLSTSDLENLDTSDVISLTTDDITSVNTKDITPITTTDIKPLTTTQIRHLTSNQISNADFSPKFLDSTAEFLNKQMPSVSPGLRSVNRAADEIIQPLFNVGGLADGGSLDELKKEWESAFCQKKITPDFVCQKSEFLIGRPLESHRLKPIRKTPMRINPLATGGLPHKYAAAAPKGHNPEFITGMTGYYACGAGTGQSDDIPAMLHDGDYVMDAETVSALGDGSSKAGRHVLEGFRQQIPHMKEGGSNPVPAKIADGEYVFPAAFVTALGGGDNKRGAEILDGLRSKLRAHKRAAPLDKIPPKAKDPIEYIKAGSK